jgi:hypothetical protein
MSALMTSSCPKTVNYAQNRNLSRYESVLQIMKLKHMKTSKACKRKLKIKIYSIVIHLTMYVCELKKSYEKTRTTCQMKTENCLRSQPFSHVCYCI